MAFFGFTDNKDRKKDGGLGAFGQGIGLKYNGFGLDQEFSIAHSFLSDGTTEFFTNTANLSDINNVIAGTNKTWTLNIAFKAGELGVTDYIFSDLGFNVTLRKNVNNTLQIILKDGGAFKSATSSTALNDEDWNFVTITHNGNLTLGNRTEIFLNAVDDTNTDNTTNTIDPGVTSFNIFAKGASESFKGNFQYLSLLDIALTPAQITILYNGGKPLDSQIEHGSNCKLFVNPDNSGDEAQFTITDSTNNIDFTSILMEDEDKVTDTMYNAVVIGIGMMEIGSTFIIS